METNTNAGRSVKAVETALQIIDELYEREEGQPTELADELGLAKSTVHDHLSTLTQHGYVTQSDDGYYLSHRFLTLGEATRRRRKAYRLTKTYVDKLAEKTDERAQFIVEENGKGIYIHTTRGEDAVQTDAGVGRQIPLHATAAGKAILSQLPEDRVREIIDTHGLPKLTDTTLTDEEALFEQLKQIRQQGYSRNRSENTAQLSAVGTPVTAPDNSVIGSLSVSGPTNRMENKQENGEIIDLLLGTKNELELKIPFS